MSHHQWVDAHHHLWQVERGDYGWLTPELGNLYADFTTDDFATVRNGTPVTKSILVQAAPTVAETEYLLSIAENEEAVSGVVGWVDFDTPEQAVADIHRLAKNPYLKGVRPMLQDIEDRQYILNPAFDDIFQALITTGLRFEILVFPDGLSAALHIVQKYPNLSCIINHCAKPQIRNGVDGDYGLYAWQKEILPFASHTNVYVKISGILTESQAGVGYDDVQPYVAWLLENFNTDRLIWGSDWPVLNLASDYHSWVDITEKLLQNLPVDTQQKITHGNAIKFYQL